MMNRPTEWRIPSKPRVPSQPRMPSQPRYEPAYAVPVQFVGSKSSRVDSAIKIQKVVRGYLVRNIIRRIAELRVELEKIEHKVSVPEIVEIIRRDNKERLRVGETIMNLLLRLDSVKVLNFSGIRECRKYVIKRAIALQLLVDQIEGINDQDQSQTTLVVDTDADFGSVGVDSLGDKMGVEEKEDEEEVCEGVDVGDKSEGAGLVEEICVVKEEEKGCMGVCELVVVNSEGEKLKALEDEEEKMDMEDKEEGVGECECVGTSLVEENCKGWRGEKEQDENNRELLERMMEDNERMIKMMTQLFEKNEMQTRLLSSLSQRVEHLERAFDYEKLRKKERTSVDAKHKPQTISHHLDLF